MTESKWKHKLLKNKSCSHQEVEGQTTTKTKQTMTRLKSSRKLCHCEPKMSPSSQGSSWYLRFNKQHALQRGPCRRQRPCTFVHDQSIWHLHFQGEVSVHISLQEENTLLADLKEMLPQLSPSGGGARSPRRAWHVGQRRLSTWHLQPGYPYLHYLNLPQVSLNEHGIGKGFPQVLNTLYHKNYGGKLRITISINSSVMQLHADVLDQHHPVVIHNEPHL